MASEPQLVRRVKRAFADGSESGRAFVDGSESGRAFDEKWTVPQKVDGQTESGRSRQKAGGLQY